MADNIQINVGKPINLGNLKQAVMDVISNLMTVEDGITLLATNWQNGANNTIFYNHTITIPSKYKSITVDISPEASEAEIAAIFSANIKSVSYANNTLTIIGTGTKPTINTRVLVKKAVLNSTIESMQVINNISMDDYESLSNLPRVNNVTLVGNKSLTDLGLTEQYLRNMGVAFMSDVETMIEDNVALEDPDIEP